MTVAFELDAVGAKAADQARAAAEVVETHGYAESWMPK